MPLKKILDVDAKWCIQKSFPSKKSRTIYGFIYCSSI